MNETKQEGALKSEKYIKPDETDKPIISLIKEGKLIDFQYNILTPKQNEVLKKYLTIIAKGGFWRKGQGENFTNNERQLIHSIKRKILIFPKKKKKFNDKEQEIIEINEILTFLKSKRKES